MECKEYVYMIFNESRLNTKKAKANLTPARGFSKN